MTRRLARGSLVAVALALALSSAPAAASAASPFTTGFTDGAFSLPAPEGDLWLGRAQAAGASIVLLGASWSAIAPQRPPNPRDPNDPSYDWSTLDATVRSAAARGLKIVLSVSSAPSWAEGANRPPAADPGTWRPDAGAFGAFMGAIALRYSGRFADPAVPAARLPRVAYWQAWSEPNLDNHLAPQWTGGQAHPVPASPAIYRGLLNAAYAAVKAVDAGNTVITGGTAPFGDPPGQGRMQPARFVRELLCLSGTRPAPCANPAHFDILAHHPYSVAAPSRAARNRDDVSVPDLAKLTRPLRAAERSGRALPRGHKRLWVTEFSYDSNPPDPQGVPESTHARYLEEAFYLFWRQGVDTAIWFNVRDQAPDPSYETTYQSGVYFRDGRPKLAFQAYRFPFVTERTTGANVQAWTRSPATGRLAIERQTAAGQWTTIATADVGRGAVVVRQLRLPGATHLRARIGSDISLVWRQP